MNRRYPQLEIDLSALRSNAQHIVRRCHERHIRVCGVVKGADGLPEVARTLRQCGADELGTSRLDARLQAAPCEKPYRAAGRGAPVRNVPPERARHAGRAGGGVRASGQDPPCHCHGRPGRPAGGFLGQGRDGGRVRPRRAGAAPWREPDVLRLHQAHAGEDAGAAGHRGPH